MNAQQLKNSILQEAIEGRLVPQDLNDEPASVLLEKIRKEKARLVKEGKLKKKDLEEIPINEDEKPFEIPKSWEWVRLGNISRLLGGFAFKSHEYTIEGSRVIRISDISENGFVNKNIVRHPCSANLEQYMIYKYDILMAMTGGTVGKSLFVKELPEDNMLLNQRVALIRCKGINVDYINYVIKSSYIQNIISDAKNSTNDNISMADIFNFFIPLPPLAEQKRIVAKIEELLPKVEEYGKAQEALDKLNEELPERLKKSILQEAIEGRLVPQDPNDEPASVLLNRIREEKKRLVKEGKLKKKDLEETPISEDEIPFKIPESWETARIYDCVEILYGFPFDSNLFNENGEGTPLIRIRDVLPSMTKTFTTERADERYIIKKGDMLVGMDGNFNVRFWNSSPAYLNQRVCKIKSKDNLLSQKFLYYYLPLALDKIFASVSYVTVKHLSDKHLRNMLIPLPPLAEQHRIVAKIEQLMKEIDKLKV